MRKEVLNNYRNSGSINKFTLTKVDRKLLND